MKSVLVLGGGGFIGRNIVEFLVNRGDCLVTAADINKGSNWMKLSCDSKNSKLFKYILGDFSDSRAFDKLEEHYDEIYMIAALVGVNKTLKFPHDVIKVNTLLTMNMIDWAKENSVKRILFASSSENYAGTSDLFSLEIPTPEDVPLCISDIRHPRWTYAISKIHGESAFYHSAKENNYECTIVRYQNIIGPEMGFRHAIPHIVERFRKIKDTKFDIYGHDQTRAFCFIDDAVRGTVGAMESDKSVSQIYHIGNDEEISMAELTKYIGNLLDYNGEYEKANTYPGSVNRRCPNIEKARADFGYTPELNWKLAVERTVEWYDEFFSISENKYPDGFEPPESLLIDQEL